MNQEYKLKLKDESLLLCLTIYKKCLLILFVTVMLSSNLVARDVLKNTIHSVHFKTQICQIKDAFNYGLVFNGLTVAGHYFLIKTNEKSTIAYSSACSFGANFNKGVGVALGIIPIDFFIGRDINRNKSMSFIFGGYFLTDYHWQLYPELQSGHMFWFTSIEIGPQILVSFTITQQEITFMFANSFAGFASRPKPGTESYFYSLKFSDFLTNAHRNLEMGSYNLFNHTKLGIELPRNTKKRLSLAYECEYFGYYQTPRLSYLTHSLNILLKIRKI